MTLTRLQSPRQRLQAVNDANQVVSARNGVKRTAVRQQQPNAAPIGQTGTDQDRDDIDDGGVRMVSVDRGGDDLRTPEGQPLPVID